MYLKRKLWDSGGKASLYLHVDCKLTDVLMKGCVSRFGREHSCVNLE